jgi:AraC-like DNA-binding protein
MTGEIIIRDTLDGIGKGDVALHLAHILCLGGSCEIDYNDDPFTIREKDCTIIRATQFVGSVRPSGDFRARILYIDPTFIEKSTPNTNYGMRGSLSLAQNPVMHLTDEEFSRCRRDFEEVERRLGMVRHHFHEELMISTVRTLILDFYDFHARINGMEEIQTQSASIMQRFIGMLERGDYRKTREVGYYASELCVAPKYLSEISKTITGHSANWWINRFTILDISRQIRDHSQTFTEISELFNFSSPAYFSRYVQRYLGESPSDYRG